MPHRTDRDGGRGGGAEGAARRGGRAAASDVPTAWGQGPKGDHAGLKVEGFEMGTCCVIIVERDWLFRREASGSSERRGCDLADGRLRSWKGKLAQNRGPLANCAVRRIEAGSGALAPAFVNLSLSE